MYYHLASLTNHLTILWDCFAGGEEKGRILRVGEDGGEIRDKLMCDDV